MSFFLFTIAVILLGIFIRVFWVQLLVIGSILFIILGIIISAALTALCFQFFSLMFSQFNDAGSFHTYFMYSLVFFTVAMVVYMSIVSDIFSMSINFIRNLFGK